MAVKVVRIVCLEATVARGGSRLKEQFPLRRRVVAPRRLRFRDGKRSDLKSLPLLSKSGGENGWLSELPETSDELRAETSIRL
ncbi:hypothetical protein OROGR_017946 [Orobanche gracilis]